MELIEMGAWVALGFVPTLIGLEIASRKTSPVRRIAITFERFSPRREKKEKEMAPYHV